MKRAWRWFTRVSQLDVCDPYEMAELRDTCSTLTQANVRLYSQNSRLRTDRDRALARAEKAEAQVDLLRCELVLAVTDKDAA